MGVHEDESEESKKKTLSETTTMVTGRGIQMIEVNHAREIHQQTVMARRPPAPPCKQQFKLPPSVTRTVQKNETREETWAAESPKIQHCRNPLCAHCGRVIVPSPVANMPAHEQPSIKVGEWEVFTNKRPILCAEEIDSLQASLGIPVPEMIFGHNAVSIRNSSAGWGISFTTPDALALVDTTGKELLQVSYSEEWAATRHGAAGGTAKGIVRPFDWTYSTDYKGTLVEGSTEFKRSDEGIPMEKLRQPDPIRFFDEMVLYEDELGDNGVSVFSCKIRVMPERLLLLSRFFLRVDNVIFRVRDTRVYVDFKENLVIREYKEQEAKYQQVLKEISPLVGDPRAYLRDPNWISQKLPVIKTEIEYVQL